MIESTILMILREWWHVITGVSLGAWWAVNRLIKSVLSKHPTHAQLDECKEDVSNSLRRLLMEHEQDEFERIDKIDEQNRLAHENIEHRIDRLDDKVSDTTSEIIAILRSSK